MAPPSNPASDMLGSLFGSNTAVSQIAQQAAKMTGMKPEMMMQMLPVVASIIMGGLSQAMQKNGFGNVLSQLGQAVNQAASAGGAGTATNPFGGILGGILSNMMGGPQAAAKPAPAPIPEPAPVPAAVDPMTASMQAGMEALQNMFRAGTTVNAQHQASFEDIIGKAFGTSK